MSARLPPTWPPSKAATVPGRLGKYTLTGVLGEGTMGTVYKGIDPLIQRPVAVKAIRAHLLEPGASDYSAAQRFVNEARAAGRLSHPGIVGVYEYGEQDGQAFIAMEYIEGRSLSQCMARPQRLAMPDLLSVMVQLLDALHYAHEQGVWHRDVKPSNIIVTGDGRLKVTDFGIARIESAELTQLTQLTQLIGSPGYIAPERYTGESPDRRVDLFSCGVLLYHLLTGASPFPGTDSEVMYKVLHKDPPPPSQARVDPAPAEVWDAIVAKALAKRPADRYATAWEFRDALVRASAAAIPATVSRAVTEWVAPVVDAPRSATAARHTPPQRLAGEAAATGRPAAGAPTGPLAQSAQIDQPAQSTGWDTALLASIERRLAQHLGPVAKVLVRRMARQCTDVLELLERLAEESLSPEDRKIFLADTARLAQATRAGVASSAASLPSVRHRGPPTGLPFNPPTLLVQVPLPTPLRPEVVAKAQRLLAGHIGPIATLMVRNATSVATSRERFFAVLAELARDYMDRDRLLKDLSRIV